MQPLQRERQPERASAGRVPQPEPEPEGREPEGQEPLGLLPRVPLPAQARAQAWARAPEAERPPALPGPQEALPARLR